MERPENINDGYREIINPLSLLEVENQRLKKQIQEYEFLMNNHPHGCLIVQEGRIAYMNKTAYEMLGCQRGNPIVGRELRELIAPEDRSRVLADLDMSCGRDTITFSFCVPTSSGEVRVNSRLLSTSISYQGKPATCFVIKDIFEISELSDPVLRSKVILQQAVDAIYDGIVVIDKRYTIKMINMKSLQMCGAGDFREVIGKQCFSIFYNRTAPCRDCPAKKAFLTCKTPPPVERTISRNGKDCSYHLFVFPLFEEGEIKYVVNYKRDLSRERELQDQLIHSERLATLGILAAKICHEINNPLSSIIGMAQLMAAQNGENEQLDLILKEGLRIKKLAHNLTALGCPSRNKLSDVSLHSVLDTVVSLVREMPEKGKGYQVEKNFLPVSPIVYGVHDQIEQVFLNLVMNAIHAMQSNTAHGVLTVGTRISSDGRFAIGYVKDNGCGIDEKDKPKIFNPFFTTKKGEEGTGIGLSVVREIVNKHRGMITFKSEVNQGTIFEVYLPLAENAGA